jgi:hypothetical protein
VLKSASRGQTVPFWTLATIGMLAMMLLVFNYALTVTWNIRAQSAAESAASAGVTSFANVYNAESTILYATAIDEYRVRALNQALLNTIAHNGGCTATVGGTCEQNYTVLRNAYNAALAAYTSDVDTLGRANAIVQGGIDADVMQTVADYAAQCSNGTSPGADCAFSYKVVSVVADQTNQYGQFQGSHNDYTTPRLVEVIACRNVPWVGARLFSLGPTFQAVGTATSASVLAQSESITPSTYQATESRWYGGATLPYLAPAYQVSYTSGSTPASQVNLMWYTTASIHNLTNVGAASYPCAS